MSDNTVERRAKRRHKVLKGGTVSFDDSGVACVVRNLSTSGATLELASSINLPTSFTLEIKADQFIRRCRRVWSRDKRIGVAFSYFDPWRACFFDLLRRSPRERTHAGGLKMLFFPSAEMVTA